MILALNNKSNLNKEEFASYQEEFSKLSTEHPMIMCPTHLNIANFNLKNCSLGAQNVSKNDKGAHTGEISATDLASYNVKYCIVGHSERRQELGETDEEINQKLKKLFQAGITPILCCGETREEREQNKVVDVITNEITKDTEGLTDEEKATLIVAYEPIWSIGTGLIPTNDEIEEVLQLIKSLLPESKILYGGSANEKNIDELKKCPTIDGYLLGGLSLKPNTLKEFIEKL